MQITFSADISIASVLKDKRLHDATRDIQFVFFVNVISKPHLNNFNCKNYLYLLFELDNEAMMASKRCSSIKLLSLTFVSKSISKSLLIKNVIFIFQKMLKLIATHKFVFFTIEIINNTLLYKIIHNLYVLHRVSKKTDALSNSQISREFHYALFPWVCIVVLFLTLSCF